jgi:hypothetical protein
MRASPLLLVLWGLWVACDGDRPSNGKPGHGAPYFIQAPDDMVAVTPKGSRQLSFFLLDSQRLPVPNRVIQFQIADVEVARGATLSLDRGVTDARGSVSLQIIAGLETMFRLRISAENAERVDVAVLVDPRKYGPVEVSPLVLGAASDSVTSIHLFLVPGAGCASVSRSEPPTAAFPRRTLPPGEVERYSAVSMDGGHALLGHGLDATGALVADGCVDLAGSAILEEGPVRVVLPAVTVLAETWGELAACRTDPGRLWLDCTVDAFGPETAEDPLDCIPTTAEEDAFGGRLTDRRGPLQRETTPAGTVFARCRQATDAAGRPSLEAQIAGMFSGQNLANLRPNLEAISRDASRLLASIGVRSYFEVTATSRPDRFQLDHDLEALELGEDKTPVDLWSLGLPVRTARLVPATTVGSDISLQQHGFTLRLGSAARLALEGILVRLGYPGDSAAFVSSIFAAASYPDRGAISRGCPALDALVCPQLGEVDCLADACVVGVAALGRRLAGVFTPLNGSGLDLFLEGTAPLIERDGDGRADSFGWLLPSSVPGVWSGQLRAGDGEYPILGIFTADRQP